MSRPEILAPAGNREMLGAAVFSGADAVYLGLTGFNARRTAGNFTPDELREAVAFCHARGVKVHVTLNTLVYDRELSGLADAVRAVAAAGADAVIADDLATAQLVKSIAPTLHLHGSTQMSVHTPEGAKELAALGQLMLTRACPLRNVRDCGKCPGGGTLRDRKGRDFTVTCSAPGGAGVRTVFNPVPLYMGERLRELPVDVAVAAFTTETPTRVSQILDLLFNAQPFDSEFTRGLYYTNN